MGVRLNQGWRLKALPGSLASQTPASLASETTPGDSACVPRLSSLLFGGDVETAVVMAVRRKLCYIELTLEQSETLQGIVRVNWEVIRLCYEAGYQSSACVSARIVCAYRRNTYCACSFHIFHVTHDVKIPPTQPRKPLECHQTLFPSLAGGGVWGRD